MKCNITINLDNEVFSPDGDRELKAILEKIGRWIEINDYRVNAEKKIYDSTGNYVGCMWFE